MKNLKKFAALLLATTMTVSLVGCGGSSDQGSTDAGTSTDAGASTDADAGSD